MKSKSTDAVKKEEDDDTFLFCDIEQDLTNSDSDSDDDEDDSESEYSDDEEDDEDLEAAEQLLRGIQENRSQRSLGSFESLMKQPKEEVKKRMIRTSLKHKEENPLGNCASLNDLQKLFKQHSSPNLVVEDDKQMKLSVSSTNLEIGHIGQEQSAQEVEVDDGAMNPDEFLAQLLGAKPQTFAYDSLEGYFLPPKPEYQDAWTADLTKTIRDHDLDTLKTMAPLQACNNFGESIVHLTVRRGTPEMLRFLLQDAGVSMRVKCDFGRTPMHDAAWCLTNNATSFQMMALLLNESPMQLLITDKRGSTPLAYVPRKKWAQCNAFLERQYNKGRLTSLSSTL